MKVIPIKPEPPAKPAPQGAQSNVEGVELEQSLFEVRRKIYPRAVHGWFASWRIALILFTQILFYGTAWLA